MMAELIFLYSEHTDRARRLPARERYVGSPDITRRLRRTCLIYWLVSDDRRSTYRHVGRISEASFRALFNAGKLAGYPRLLPGSPAQRTIRNSALRYASSRRFLSSSEGSGHASPRRRRAPVKSRRALFLLKARRASSPSVVTWISKAVDPVLHMPGLIGRQVAKAGDELLRHAQRDRRHRHDGAIGQSRNRVPLGTRFGGS